MALACMASLQSPRCIRASHPYERVKLRVPHHLTKTPLQRPFQRHLNKRHLPRALPIINSASATATTSVISSFTSYIQGSIDPTVFAATAAASYKLFLVCIVTGWLLKSKRIPETTASVLSQVSFQLLIPCMLFSKVAGMLATSPDTSFLIGMCVAAVAQIIIGAVWGSLLAPFVDARVFDSLLNKFNLFGWQPFNAPTRSPAAVIANATALATGLPQAAGALLPRPAPVPTGLRALIIASSAFGNSFTLPAVFFLSLLPGALGGQAIAYSGLFLLAWSPCLWSFGFALVENGFLRGQKQENNNSKLGTDGIASGDASAIELLPESANSTSTGTSSTKSSSSNNVVVGQLQPMMKKLKLSTIASVLRRFISRAMNPPVLAILFGTIVGLSSAGKQLLLALRSGAVAAAAATATHSSVGGGGGASLPFELSLAWYSLKGAFEVIEMLAVGTLAMQTLVLASSLLQSMPSSTTTATATATAAAPTTPTSTPASGSRYGFLRTVWTALAPSDAIEARTLAILSVNRFVLVPMSCIFLWQWVAASGLAGALAADPLFLFVIAVQCVMPSAQNLIIMLQLSEVTRPAAPQYARLLLKLYAYAVLPVTLWVTAFASRLSIPLV